MVAPVGDIVKELVDAPLANLLIVAGLAFLALAVVGKITGKIEPGRGGRIMAGLLGSALFVGGLIAHLRQHPELRAQKEKETTPANTGLP